LTVSSSTPTKWRRTFEVATSSALSENNIIRVRNRNLNARFSRPRHAHDSCQENAQSIILVRLKAAVRRPRLAGFTFSSPTVAGPRASGTGPPAPGAAAGCQCPSAPGAHSLLVLVLALSGSVGRGWVVNTAHSAQTPDADGARLAGQSSPCQLLPVGDGPRRTSAA
jgi:hypothetical protein